MTDYRYATQIVKTKKTAYEFALKEIEEGRAEGCAECFKNNIEECDVVLRALEKKNRKRDFFLIDFLERLLPHDESLILGLDKTDPIPGYIYEYQPIIKWKPVIEVMGWCGIDKWIITSMSVGYWQIEGKNRQVYILGMYPAFKRNRKGRLY